MAPEARRSHADIDRDVKDLAVQHLNQLGLPVGVLEMQAPQNIALGTGDVVLHEGGCDPEIRIARRVIGLEKLPARVSEYLRLDQQDAGKVRFSHVHGLNDLCLRFTAHDLAEVPAIARFRQ